LARRSLTALEDTKFNTRGGYHNNVLVTKTDWTTLVSLVCYASLVSASADRDSKTGSKCWGYNMGLYINDLPKYINPLVQTKLFADDVKLYATADYITSPGLS